MKEKSATIYVFFCKTVVAKFHHYNRKTLQYLFRAVIMENKDNELPY
jgi:hypothetical protein